MAMAYSRMRLPVLVLLALLAQQCHAAISCPPVEGYDVIPNADHPSDDIGRASQDYADNAPELITITAQVCSEDTGCVSFNSGGYYKRLASPVRWHSSLCLYVKQGAATVDCPSAEHYNMYLDTDHEGDTKDRFVGNGDVAEVVDLVSKSCDEQDDCAGFTSEGEVKTEVMPTQPAAGKCLYMKEGRAHCPRAEGFVAQHDADHWGDDIMRVEKSSNVELVVEAAAAACRDSAECVAFNTDGYIKRSAEPWTDSPGMCLYRKVMDSPMGPLPSTMPPAPSPPAPGYYGGYGGYGGYGSYSPPIYGAGSHRRRH